MGQFQSLFFADTSIDANTLVEKTLKEIADTHGDFRIISLPHCDFGTDRPYDKANSDQPCAFYCQSRHAAVLTVSPCAHRILCYQCYDKLLADAANLNCPICNATITAIN